MKNKKLFAILTLVCFMFTLMPVAAMAEGDGVLNDQSGLFDTGVTVSSPSAVTFQSNSENQDGVKTHNVATKTELNTAIETAEDGDIIQLTADIDYGTDHLEINKVITLDLGDKTLTTKAINYGLALKGGCSVINGKLNHAGTVAAIKVWDAQKITDLEIDVTGTSSSGNEIGGIVIQANSAGVDLIENVKIYSTSGQGIANGIETYECGNAIEPVIGAMKNVTIDAKDTGMLISAPCGTATNCDIKGGVSGIEIWIKGTYSAKLDLVDCDVEGGTQAVYAHDEFNSNPNIVNKGTIKLTVDEKTAFESQNGVVLNKTIARVTDEQVILGGLTETAVAKVGDVYYTTLTKAVEATQDVEGDAIVELVNDTTLGEKLTISNNVTISGDKTITRDDAYTGTLFAVNNGATLTLDGGLTIDGANDYAFNSEQYAKDLADWETPVAKEDSAKWFTPEEGAPVATAYMITTGGTVNLKDVTIQNHYSTNGSGIVSASKGAEVTLDGAKITHNASTAGSGLVVNASAGVWSRDEKLITVIMNDGTVIDGNHVGGNHGIFKIYMGTYFTMNGGEIKNTTGWNSNGTAVGIYHAVFTMNGGTICSNSSTYGPNNGRNAAIYGHSNHLFTMNGGTVCHNTGRAKAGIDSPYSETGYTGQTVINGGSVTDNTVLGTWTEPDVSGGDTLTITGGEYTQDVSKWLKPGLMLIETDTPGVYGVEKQLETGEVVEEVSVRVGKTVELTKVIGEIVEWTSADETIATVENGVVTGKKAGTVTITATVSEIVIDGETETKVKQYTATYTVNVYNVSSGGGFSGKYNYPVNIADTIGADVTADQNYAVAGETVIITVDPDAGRQVDEVIATDADGDIIPVTKVGDNKYSFTMPAGKVNVSVTTEAADYDLRIVMQINNKNILVNNRTFTNDVAPVIVGDRTMVPIRVVTETLGGTADWNANTQTVTLKIDGKVLTMTIGKVIPGIGVAPVIMDDRTYVPIRYVAEKLGANVEWIAATQQIIIEQ